MTSKTFEKGQTVTIKRGRHAGCKAWFDQISKRPGGEHCFVYFKTRNISGAQVRVDDLETPDETRRREAVAYLDSFFAVTPA